VLATRGHETSNKQSYAFRCAGIKIAVSGRLGGAEIARREWFVQGKLPLSTLKSDVDYGYSIAVTKYGTIGVKCWIYKGDVEDLQELLPPRGLERQRGARKTC